MTIRLGIIGLSPGNGHPYSWSAICNNYDFDAMAECEFPAIPEYLSRQSWPVDQLPGARVTHIWTQDVALSAKIARASHIENVVNKPEEMIGKIDALLLARDDAHNHRHFAEPFLRAGLPVYIDKPIALSKSAFNALIDLQVRPGQIFSCSALRFAPELKLNAKTAARIGSIQLIQGMTPKYWETYAIHLIDPLLLMLGHKTNIKRLFTGSVGKNGRFLALRWYDNGPDVHLMATGTNIPSPLSLRVIGEKNEITLTFNNSFTAFRNALGEFIAGVDEGHSRLPEDFNLRAVQLIEMGLQ